MITPAAPPANASPREVARFLLSVLDDAAVHGVLVGTTAILAAGDIEVRSKDTDVVVIGARCPARLKRALKSLASRAGLRYAEPGWGIVSLSRHAADSSTDAPAAWTGDIIFPAGGIIPAAAARLVARDAVETDWGPAACMEHILVMKAVAAADRAADGQPLLVLKYEQHLELIAARHGKPPECRRARELLPAYPKPRQLGAVGLVRDAFGVDLMEKGST